MTDENILAIRQGVSLHPANPLIFMARPRGLDPLAFGFAREDYCFQGFSSLPACQR